MGPWIWIVAVAAVASAAVVFGRRVAARRGPRLVECPEVHETAAVSVNAVRAATGAGWRLADCSRWPEREACGRECLAQIERTPDDCLVRTIVSRWYEGKDCATCGRPIGRIDWYERKPTVVDAAGRSRPWPEVSPETLPNVLATHRPLCFDCFVAATFRREHPDLVLDNPFQPGR